MEDWDYIENCSMIWNVPVAQAVFRLAQRTQPNEAVGNVPKENVEQ